MKTPRRIAAPVLCSLALAGCASVADDNRPPDARLPSLSVAAGGVTIVDQEPLVFPASQRNKSVTLRWTLPKHGALSFPPDGVVFEQAAEGEIVNCRPSKDRSEFSCDNRHSRPGRYRYTVKVMDGDRVLDGLDLLVVNG